MPVYDISQVIGASLYAKKTVEIKANAFDDAPVVRQVLPGELVGVVYSYLSPTVGRSSLYWMFEDSINGTYYAEHDEGTFEIYGLGEVYPEIITSNWWDDIFPDFSQDVGTQVSKYLTTGLIIYAGFKFGPEIIKSLRK